MQLQDLRAGDAFRVGDDPHLYTVIARCECGQLTVRDETGERRRFCCQEADCAVTLTEAFTRRMGG